MGKLLHDIDLPRHMLPLGATIPEKVLASLGPLIHELDVPISRMWDPWLCPIEALPFLAWALRAPLWDDTWSETKKRSVLAESPELNAVKGTVYALQRYVEIMGGRVVDIVLPPSGIYLSAGPDAAEKQAWLERFAEIRIYDRPGSDTVLWDFLDEAYLSASDDPDDGLYLSAYTPRPKRRAELHDGGQVSNLEMMETRVYTAGGATRITERIFGSGSDQGGYYLNEAFADDYLLPVSPVLFVSAVNGIMRAREGVDAVLISPIPEKVTVSGTSEDFYLGDGLTDDGFLLVSSADRMIYESYRLYDPLRSVGFHPDGFCMGDPDLFELQPNHVLVDIDARFPLDLQAAFYGSFVGDYWFVDDGVHRQRLHAATAAANPTSDLTLASTALHRPIRFSDGLPFGSFSFGEMINSKEIIHHA